MTPPGKTARQLLELTRHGADPKEISASVARVLEDLGRDNAIETMRLSRT